MKQITLGDPKDAAASMASSVAFINLGQWSGLLKPFRKGGSGVHVDLHDGTGQSLLLERGKVRRTDQFNADAAQAICHLADLIQSPFLAKKLVAPGYDQSLMRPLVATGPPASAAFTPVARPKASAPNAGKPTARTSMWRRVI